MFGLRSSTETSTTASDAQRLSLADVTTGQRAILSVPEVDTQLCRRLAQLGLRPGMTVTAGHFTAGGGRVIRSGGSRYAIDAATLRYMYVS